MLFCDTSPQSFGWGFIFSVIAVASCKSCKSKINMYKGRKDAKVQKVQKDFHIDQITKLQNCKWKNQIGLLGGEA